MKRDQKQKKVYIYGAHSLAEALMYAPQVLQKVYVAPEVKDKDLRALLSKHSIPTEQLRNNGAGLVPRDTTHQGLIGVMNPDALVQPLDAILDGLDMNTNPALVLLDEVQDPHNVGAIIRSAAALGASGVLIPKHNQAPVTGAVVKTSAGMAFRVPIAAIGNVNNTVAQLKERGFWTYGLAADGTDVQKETFDAPALFIVGNEAYGIRPKTLEHCDVTLSIPMHPRAESLNAAASAAIALYQWSTQHPDALRDNA